jgi:hypothetical protein
MQLYELITTLDQLDDDHIICVKRPWSWGAEAQLAAPDEHLAVPDDVKRAGFAYFLEVHVAKEVICVFGEKPANTGEKVRLLVEYAENDAYPQWVYQR